MAVNIQKESGSAISLDKVESQGGVDLAKKAKAAGVVLEKQGLLGMRADVILYVDYSGSMRPFYEGTSGSKGFLGIGGSKGQPGVVQQIVDRTLGFAMQVDEDGVVPVQGYESDLTWQVDAKIDNYEGLIDQAIKGYRMGGTCFAPPLEQLLSIAKTATRPIFVFFVTDGSPSDKPETRRLVAELADYPVFIKFMAVHRDGWDFLDELNNLESRNPRIKRTVDNVNAVKCYDPANISDEEFIELVLEEWSDWFKSATSANVLARA